ncbi:RCC domain-containing protein Ats1 [Schizosaccharomyces japonicus yFS275]|uniref:RCC domain-containing protein Ats1 n=1 Tax=Schizosaccharomyces japonicus (strain yFS275 / FY16936) TaxID=402676 RepID=B6K8E5_SCHJY|nr:RCC domain-containing protein Ats1 [Schizosaccharomyces japonicus yFS275]EEB09799.1 RCC domain-containing protein Ats1 [Schizosaccharomyces japonicus yFS275]
MLYSFGSNGNFQLGLNHHEDVAVPTKVGFAGTVKAIACGGNHTLLLDKQNKVWATGLNSSLQCGQPFWHKKKAVDHVIGFQPILTSICCSLISAGWEFTLVVDLSQKMLFTCGVGPHGELGLGVKGPKSFSQVPIPLETGEIIISMAAGLKHWVCVTSAGRLYGCGDGRKGQLSSKVINTVSQPVLIGVFPGAKKVVCGVQFTGILFNSGELKILGNTKWRITDEYAAWVANEDNRQLQIVDVSSNWSTLTLLTDKGNCLAFGRGDRAQKAHSRLEQPVHQVSGGSEHNIVLLETRQAIVYGWNEHGNAGLQHRKDVYTAVPLKLDAPVTLVAAGYATSWIVTESASTDNNSPAV